MRIVPHRPSIHAHTHAHTRPLLASVCAAWTACSLASPMRDDAYISTYFNVHMVFVLSRSLRGLGRQR